MQSEIKDSYEGEQSITGFHFSFRENSLGTVPSGKVFSFIKITHFLFLPSYISYHFSFNDIGNGNSNFKISIPAFIFTCTHCSPSHSYQNVNNFMIKFTHKPFN